MHTAHPMGGPNHAHVSPPVVTVPIQYCGPSVKLHDGGAEVHSFPEFVQQALGQVVAENMVHDDAMHKRQVDPFHAQPFQFAHDDSDLKTRHFSEVETQLKPVQ